MTEKTTKLIPSGDPATLQSLDDVREAWRRLEAQGDPLGLRNGKKHGPSESPAEPTPERRAKAIDIGRQVVGKHLRGIGRMDAAQTAATLKNNLPNSNNQRIQL